MSDEPQPGVIGSLPRTRPHRRSEKRAAPRGADAPAEPKDAAETRPARTKSARPARTTATQAAKPAAASWPRTAAAKAAPSQPAAARPPAPPPERPAGEPSPGVLETAVQAAAELAEIGLHASARVLRRAVSRLPRP